MAVNRKTENGITYTLERRRHPSLGEGVVYWLGEDESTLELTYEEQLARDTSKAITE